MVNPPIKSGSELDWAAVRKAANGILKHAENAGYMPPEATREHTALVAKVCEAMNAITDALKLRRQNKHELTATKACSLFDSDHAYADGMVRISCNCGWQSTPIRSRDSATIFSTHVMQELQK